MNEEMEKGVVVGDESKIEGLTLDATGAVVREETVNRDKKFDDAHRDVNDWREQP